MHEPNEKQRQEELLQQAESARRAAFEVESQRLDRETEDKSKEAVQSRLQQEQAEREKKIQDSLRQRQEEEAGLRARSEDTFRILREEREKRMAAREQEKAQREKDEEEQRLKQELVRRKVEEEQRRAAQELQKQAATTQKQRPEAEHRPPPIEEFLVTGREDPPSAPLPSQSAQRAAETHRRELERQERVQSLLNNAQLLFTSGEYDRALVEVAKALVNDPTNGAALDLRQRIKDLKGEQDAVLIDEEPSSIRPEPSTRIIHPKPVEHKVRGRSRPFLLAVIIVVFVVGTLYFLRLREPAPAASLGFAILPWTGTGGSADERVYGIALAGEVAACFEYSTSMPVMGYRSASTLARASLDPLQSSFRLGYPFVLHGTITQTPDGYHFNLKLVDSAGSTRWSREYERRTLALASLPKEVAQEVASALPNVRRDEARSLGVRTAAAVSPEAYLQYLRGREVLQRGSTEQVRSALGYFDNALKSEPGFAGALSASSVATTRAWFSGLSSDEETLDRAQKLATEAISTDRSSGEPYVALALTHAARKEFQTALELIDSALLRSPNSSDIHLERGKIRFSLGKHRESLADLHRAYDLSPRDLEILRTLAGAYQLSGTPRQAMWYHEAALFFVDDSTEYLGGPFADAVLLDPGLILAQSNRIIAAYERRTRSHPNDYLAHYRYGRLLQVLGRVPDAEARLEIAESLLRRELHSKPKDARIQMYLALTLTRLGRFPDAIALAKKAINLGGNHPEVRYRVAQMYSIQMYSQREKKVDEKKKVETVQALRDAIARAYQIDELTNADFYNTFNLKEFRSLIREQI